MKKQVMFRSDVMRETQNGLSVVASRCKKCGTIYFPPEEICLRDLNEEMEIIEVPKYGTLYTYTVMYKDIPPFPKPHALCQVDYDNGMRVQGILMIEDPSSLEKGNEFKIGSPVELVICPLYEDEENEYIGFKYKVIAQA